MTQFINYDNKVKKVMVYHTNINKSGTADFEHKGMVLLNTVALAKKSDGGDNPDYLYVECPVPGCITRIWVPINGNTEAQRLHAKVGEAQNKMPTFRNALETVKARIEALGSSFLLDIEGEITEHDKPEIIP